MILHSRQHKSADGLVREFLESLTIHLTPRTNWERIDCDLQIYRDTLTYFKRADTTDIHELMQAAPDVRLAVQAGFRLLGYQGIAWQHQHDDDFSVWTEELLASGDKQLLHEVCQVLKMQGLRRILDNGNLDAIFLGHLLRHYRTLDAHDDSAFYNQVDNLVQTICENTSFVCKKHSALPIDDVRHTMDYILFRHGQPIITIHATYYSVAGSFPFELQKGAEFIMRLHDKGITPICILDGKGFYRMQKALKKAYHLLPNIYTLQQALDYLAQDIR